MRDIGTRLILTPRLQLRRHRPEDAADIFSGWAGSPSIAHLLRCPPLTFAAPDLEAFPCLALALECARKGGTSTAILNGANEAAVALFLNDKVKFLDIPRLVAGALDRVEARAGDYGLEDVFEADRAARAAVSDLMR